MSMSTGRPLALMAIAALGGAAGAGVGAAGSADAEAKAKAKPQAAATRAKARRKATARVRAVKIGAGAGWVPAEALGAELAPLTGTGAGGAAGGAASGGPPTATTPTITAPTTTTPLPNVPPTVQAVGVTLDDRGGYSARLSRPAVAAGAVVVQLINQGEDDHNLRVVPTDHDDATVDFPLTAAGANATRTLTLKPGTYRVFCTLTTPVNHEAAGMNATLKVSSAAS
ncbi:hypothetical protein DSM104299_01961 [Baekduia alba]|uniref:cupredoxin domain-containing protein n=1 Tax=Baekduia alba TaxID=2997333 RepID=UPI002340D939|nr:plastocyanin/azurin family copper-binding protein [Baekduia alba]WCB93254.1 hypothetical protein DSM104299_01961 [Baekduia alba]